MTLPLLPPAGPLALAGMGFLALFALWKGAVAPRIHRARHRATAPT